MNVPKVLLYFKKSAYLIYFKESRGRSFYRRAVQLNELNRFKETHDTHYRSLKFAENCLKGLGIPFDKKCRGRKIDFSKYDLVVTIGGDGTFLEAARQIGRQQKILGFNSDPKWSVGRFCYARVENFKRILSNILSQNERRVIVNRIEFHAPYLKTPIVALNDLLICHQNPAAMSRYYLIVNGRKEEQRSSGVWVSTAAGSTGALHSAGGKVLPLASPKAAYLPRELYETKKMRYQLKGGSVDLRKPIRLISLMRKGNVYIDGSRICQPFDFGCEILVKRSSNHLQVITG